MPYSVVGTHTEERYRFRDGTTVPWPAGHQTGDVLVLCCTIRADIDLPNDTFNGWFTNLDAVVLDDYVAGRSAGEVSIGIAYQIATSNAMPDIVLPVYGSAGSNNNTLVAATFRGVTPPTFVSSAINLTGSTVAGPSGAVVAGDRALWFVGGSYRASGQQVTNPAAANTSGMTLLDWIQADVGTGSGSYLHDSESLGGTVGPFTANNKNEQRTAALLNMPLAAGAPAAQDITSAFISSASTVFAASLTAGAVALSGVFIPSASEAFAGSVGAGAVSVSSPFIQVDNAVYSGSISEGALTLSGAFIAPDSAVFPGGVSIGLVSLSGAFISSADTVYPLQVSVGAVALSSAFIASQSVVSPGSVATGGSDLVGAFIAPQFDVYPGDITTGAASISAAFIAPQSEAYPGSLSVGQSGAVTLPHAFISPVSEAYAASFFAGPVSVDVAYIADTSAAYAGSVTLGATEVSAAYIAATSQVFPASSIALGDVEPAPPISPEDADVFEAFGESVTKFKAGGSITVFPTLGDSVTTFDE